MIGKTNCTSASGGGQNMYLKYKLIYEEQRRLDTTLFDIDYEHLSMPSTNRYCLNIYKIDSDAPGQYYIPLSFIIYLQGYTGSENAVYSTAITSSSGVALDTSPLYVQYYGIGMRVYSSTSTVRFFGNYKIELYELSR